MVESRERPIKEANVSNARDDVEVLVDVQVGHYQYVLAPTTAMDDDVTEVLEGNVRFCKCGFPC